MNKLWYIENGVLKAVIDNQDYYPSSEDLYSQRKQTVFRADGKEIPSPTESLGIRISSILLCPEFTFTMHNENLLFKLYALKGDERIAVPVYNGFFLGYVIVKNVCYCLDSNYHLGMELIKKAKISVINFSFKDYISIRNLFAAKNFNYVDDINNNISSLKNISEKFCPAGLMGNLYPYQEKGCNWMNFMVNNGCGFIVGDEMGLGKTLQVISLIGSSKIKNERLKSLVICPVSLLENWKREIERFFPSLSAYIHYGVNRTGNYKDILLNDIVIVSYGTVQTDLSMFLMVNWDYVVVDEAQNIKNPQSKRSKNIKKLKRKISVAITGTPFENHMTDVWSIVDFVMPGYLGSYGRFKNTYSDDLVSAAKIEKQVSPVMIRRKVDEVATDLPERVDIPVPILMTREEAQFYDDKRKEIALEDLNLLIFEKIQGLRMFCTHPLVYKAELTGMDPMDISTKYQRLCGIIEDIVEMKEKAIIFTSFNKMINIIVQDLHQRFGIFTDYINGEIPAAERQHIIDRFSKISGAAVLVLNPRAAGTGLNITCANHVIHYNLEWNPAVEDQASARSYRRGQEKTVFVYRLYYTNTIEDVINEAICSKRQLSDTAIVGNHGDLDDKKKILKVLSMTPYN